MTQSIEVRITADGFVDAPADEIDAGATYTFEACVNDRGYRWVGQRPMIVGDRARFWLRDGAPIEVPNAS
jgi:hypothetical protein